MHGHRRPFRRVSIGVVALLGLAIASCGDDEKSPRGDAGVDAGPFVPRAIAVSGTATFDSVPATYTPGTGAVTLDFGAVTEKPVRGAVVQLRRDGTVLATTTTDDTGAYAISATSDAPGTVVVAVLTRISSPSIQVVDNTDGDAVWGMSHALTADTGTVDLHATHGWNGSAYDATRRVAAPFAVLDALTTAARSFLAVRAVTFPALTVNWSPDNVPQSGDKADGFIGTSHYDPVAGEIYVLGKDQVDTDEFDAHVIAHEWTHYFEAQLSRSDSPGGPHGEGDVLDPRIAWGEGLGNAVAAMALADRYYVDTTWGGSGWSGFAMDAETVPTPSDDPTPGVFSERSVHRILFDLFDGGSNEGFDTVALGLGPIYDVLVGAQRTTPARTTIGSFIAGLKAQAGVNAAAVNTLLAQYDVGAITDAWGTGDADLAGMTTTITVPNTSNLQLGGGHASNTYEQNQYFRFEGTGSGVRVSATSTQDVGIALYRAGETLGEADEFLTGTESFTVASTQVGTTYVVVLTGFAELPGDYAVTVTIENL